MLYSELEYQVEHDAELRQQLNHLYESYIRNGMALSRETVEGVLKPSIWQSFDLVSFNSSENRWLIQPEYLFAYYVLNAKVSGFTGRLPHDMGGLSLLYEKATEQPDNSFSSNIMRLHERILELILRSIYERTGSDFSGWIEQSADDSNERIKFEFLEAYCTVADDLPLSGRSIVNACRQFLSWRDGVAELNVNKLLVRYATNNHEAATNLLRSIIDSDDRAIQSSLLGGLLEGDAERCWPLIEGFYGVPKYQAFIMNALPRLTLSDSTTGWRLLNLLLTYDRTVEANRMTMPFTLTRVADRVGFTDTDFIQKCYDELDELAQVEQLQTIKCVLRALRISVEKYPVQSVKVLLTLLTNSIMTHEHIGKLNYHPSFDDVLHYITDVNLVFTFFEEYARRYATHFKHDTFYTTVYTSYRRPTTTLAFREKVLSCLINDNGKIRVFGNQLLNFFNHYGHPFEFHIDINTLSPIKQYKLILSILLFSLRPKYTLPLIMPLLKSKEPIIVEVLLCKLEELTESYHNEIIRLVEDYALQEEPANAQTTTALARLKTHYSKICSQLDEKRSIMEFHPSICQTAIFNRFNEIHRYKMNERMHTVMEKSDGLISVFKKVELAKGGGWKHSKGEGISKLGHHQSSFTWPRLHLINPEMFDMEHRMNRSADWASDKTDFIEWIIE